MPNITPTELRQYATRAKHLAEKDPLSKGIGQNPQGAIIILSDAVLRLLDQNEKMRGTLERCHYAVHNAKMNEGMFDEFPHEELDAILAETKKKQK